MSNAKFKCSYWNSTGWVLALILLVFLCSGITFSIISEHSYSEMDWNGDGKRSLAEIFESLDIGKKQEIRNGVPCITYYQLKDASEVKIFCADSS